MRNFNITVNGQVYSVSVEESGSSAPAVQTAAPAAQPAPAVAPVKGPAPAAAPAVVPDNGTKINAPMPGNIIDVEVGVGDSVKVGDKLVILEALKMENDITSPVDGTVAAVAVKKGDVVSTGDLMVVIG